MQYIVHCQDFISQCSTRTHNNYLLTILRQFSTKHNFNFQSIKSTTITYQKVEKDSLFNALVLSLCE